MNDRVPLPGLTDMYNTFRIEQVKSPTPSRISERSYRSQSPMPPKLGGMFVENAPRLLFVDYAG